jgi:hypothetical protein
MEQSYAGKSPLGSRMPILMVVFTPLLVVWPQLLVVFDGFS